LYSTGICESTHAKRTIVSLITGLKRLLPSPVVTLRRGELNEHSFTEVVTENGCIHLKGYAVPGQSLYQLYQEKRPRLFYSQATRSFLRCVLAVIDAAVQYRNRYGGFPFLIMNGVYVTGDLGEVSFLPGAVVDHLNAYYDDALRQVVYYPCTERRTKRRQGPPGEASDSGKYFGPGRLPVQEYTFTHTLARLLYFFFVGPEQKKIRTGRESSTLYLITEIEDAPASIADLLWDILRGGEVPLERLRDTLETCLRETDETRNGRRPTARVPFSKRRGVIHFKTGLYEWFGRRWRLLLVVCIVCAIGVYLLGDALNARNSQDHTAGLSAGQVVELYYEAVNDLNLEVIDSIFYRRSGKQVRDELSTVYVMLKMESAFGKNLVSPDDIGENGFQPEYHSVFGIDDLELELLENGSNPVYRASYVRVISSAEELHTNRMVETIHLKYIADHWYITKSERVIEDSPPDT
jgi:hypothetical protein